MKVVGNSLRSAVRNRLRSSRTIRLSRKDIPLNMRCILQTGYGAAEESLGFGRVMTPMVSPYDVLVRVKASSVNQIDAKLRWGYGKKILHLGSQYPRFTSKPQKVPPFIIGRDFSGEIVQVGSAVPEMDLFQLNKPVFGLLNQLSAQGSWAEYVKVPFWCVAEKPDYLSFEEASSIPFSLSGALELLYAYSDGKMLSPEQIVISGGGTGGSVAYYIAMLFISQGIQPTSLVHSDPKILHDLKVFDTMSFSEENFVRKCTPASAVFIPNPLKSMQSLLDTIDDLRMDYLMSVELDDLSPKNIINKKCQLFQLTPLGLDISERLGREGIDLMDGETPYPFLINQFEFVYQDPVTMTTKLNRVDTTELSIYPCRKPQRKYYLGLRNVVDELHDYVTRWTNRTNPACVEKIFPFSMAKEAHQMIDDGENTAKIVLSMDELWNNDDEHITYKQHTLHTVDIPPVMLFPFLRDSRA